MIDTLQSSPHSIGSTMGQEAEENSRWLSQPASQILTDCKKTHTWPPPDAGTFTVLGAIIKDLIPSTRIAPLPPSPTSKIKQYITVAYFVCCSQALRKPPRARTVQLDESIVHCESALFYVSGNSLPATWPTTWSQLSISMYNRKYSNTFHLI